MRVLCLAGLLALLVAAFVHLVSVDASSPTVLAATPDDATPEPMADPTRDRPYRSYSAPTGVAGFRIYYQMRCYPGCHYGVDETTPEPTRESPYRSYPALTGVVGFRVCYQKRCSPGRHYGTDV